jgi:hypothetical protein
MKEQSERCYECFKAITERLDFDIKDSCPVYQSCSELSDHLNCFYFQDILKKVRQFQNGERSEEVTEQKIVRMLIDR